MFSRIAIAIVSAAIVVAGPVARGGGESCSTGPIQCCNSLHSATDSHVATLGGLLGLDLSSVTGQIGLTCNPISVLGLGGNSCNAQTVCCTGNNFNGLIAMGCTPINVNL